jgi:Ku protein
MRAEDRVAVAQVVFAGRAQLAVVRPTDGVLAMSLLHYASEVKPAADFRDEVHAGGVSAQERKLAESLIEAATAESFDLGAYKDAYGAKLAKLVEGKSRAAGKKSKAAAEEPAVINLMDALRQSLARTKHAGTRKRAVTKAVRRPAPRRRTA